MDGAYALNYILDNQIEGVLVECGVETGNFEEIWITELQKRNVVRDIYLYDTFCGLTEPGEYDYTCKNSTCYQASKEDVYNTWKSYVIDEKTNNWCYSPLKHVRMRLSSTGYPEENLHYIVGDVMETLLNKENIPDKIAILRLDTDWYESSKFELERLYENVVKDGLIIFDDYYHWDGQRRATDDFLQSIHMEYDFINVGNGKTATIIKK